MHRLEGWGKYAPFPLLARVSHSSLYFPFSPFFSPQVKSNNLDGIPVMLVGNKCDEEQGKREVNKKTGEALQVGNTNKDQEANGINLLLRWQLISLPISLLASFNTGYTSSRVKSLYRFLQVSCMNYHS